MTKSGGRIVISDMVRVARGATPAQYITKLLKAEHDAEEWQAAMQALLLVVEHDGPTIFARIGVMRALNRHVERVFDPSKPCRLASGTRSTKRSNRR